MDKRLSTTVDRLLTRLFVQHVHLSPRRVWPRSHMCFGRPRACWHGCMVSGCLHVPPMGPRGSTLLSHRGAARGLAQHGRPGCGDPRGQHPSPPQRVPCGRQGLDLPDSSSCSHEDPGGGPPPGSCLTCHPPVLSQHLGLIWVPCSRDVTCPNQSN